MKIVNSEQYLYTKLKKKDLEESIEELLDFMTAPDADLLEYIEAYKINSSQQQIFYEMIQNAEDAHASSLWIYFNENYFFVFNNGEKFIYKPDKPRDEKIKGELYSFLANRRSEKSKSDDLSLGKKGFGSKALYNLMGDIDHPVGFSKEIYNGAGIYFVSGTRSQLNSLRMIKSLQDLDFEDWRTKDCLLFFKIMQTYFPALPGSRKKMLFADTEKRELFAEEEMLQIIQGINHFYKEYLCPEKIDRDFNLLIVPLGKGQKAKIDSLSNEINDSIASLLGRLKYLKEVYVNGRLINNKEWYTELIPANETDVEIGVIYPKTVIPGRNMINIHQYLPLLSEKYHLGFILDFPQELILPDVYRQTLNDKLDHIEKYQKMLERVYERFPLMITENRFKEFRSLYLSVLAYNPIQSWQWLGVYKDFRANVKRMMLTICGKLKMNRDEVYFRVSPLAALPEQLQIHNKWYADAEIQQFVEENHEIIKEQDGLPEHSDYPLYQLINDAQTTPLNKWLSEIKESEYRTLIDTLREENGVIEVLKPCIRLNNGSVISLEELKKRTDIGVLFTGADNFIALFNRHQIPYTLFSFEDSVFRGHPDFNVRFFYDRTVRLFKDRIETMSRSERAALNMAFQKGLEVCDEFRYYEQDIDLLFNKNKTLENIASIPDFDHTFLNLIGLQLLPSERSLGKGTLPKENLWAFLINKWSNIQSIIEIALEIPGLDRNGVLCDFYGWLSEVYNYNQHYNSTIFLNGISLYADIKGNFGTAANYRLVSVTHQSDIDGLQKIMENNGLRLAPGALNKRIREKPFEIKPLSIADLFHNGITERQITLEELSILQKEFSDFALRVSFKQTSAGFLIKKLDSRESNCFYEGRREVEECIESNESLFALPKVIFELQSDTNKKKLNLLTNDELKQKLLSDTSASRKLIHFVTAELVNENENVFCYIDHCPPINLLIDEDYNNQSFEYKLFELIADNYRNKRDAIRNKIRVQNQNLSDLTFSDASVVVRNDTFLLKDFGFAADYTYQKILSQFSSKVQIDIFQKTEITASTIYEQYIQKSSLTATQLFFLLAYSLTQPIDKECLLSIDQLILSDLSDFMNLIYSKKDEWRDITDYFSFNVSKRYFIEVEENLLLADESVRNRCYYRWSKDDKERLAYLAKIKVCQYKNNEIELREIFRTQKGDGNCKILSPKQQPAFLRWLHREQLTFSQSAAVYVNRTIEEYAKKDSDIFYIVQPADAGMYALQQIDSKDKKVALLAFKDLEAAELIGKEYPFLWIKEDVKSSPYGSRLKTCTLQIIRKADHSYSEKEWDSEKYRQWYNANPKEHWRIFVIFSSSFLVNRILLEDGVEKVKLNNEKSKFVWHEESGNKYLIIGLEKASVSGLLSFLEEHKKEIFTNKSDALIYSSLLEHFMPSKQALDFLERDEAADILHELQIHNDLPRVLEALRQNHLGKSDGEGDGNEEENNQKIDKLNGLMGEYLVMEYLSNLKMEVYHNDCRDYDILYKNMELKHYVEVKTQAATLMGDRIDFHFGKLQINKVRNLSSDEVMEIVHISLMDLNIYDKVLAIKRDNDKMSEKQNALKRLASDFFRVPMNTELFKRSIVSLKLDRSTFI